MEMEEVIQQKMAQEEGAPVPQEEVEQDMVGWAIKMLAPLEVTPMEWRVFHS